MPTLSILSPFDGQAVVTTSSSHGHHRPYGGNISCDMDVLSASRGTPVFFEAVTDGPPVRAVVESVRPACRSGKLEDGGLAVQFRLQRCEGLDRWIETGMRILFGHLDPLDVAPGDVLPGGRVQIGALGPAAPQDWPVGRCGTAHASGDPRRQEYHSTCATHSHLHLEGFGAATLTTRGESLTPGSVAATFMLVDTGSETSASTDQALAVAMSSTAEIPVLTASQYVVKTGDRLVEVAARLGVALPVLVDANPDLLRAGQVLTVPGLHYEVCPRDTLGEIAIRFGVTLQALAAANQIVNVNVIRVGQILVIPR